MHHATFRFFGPLNDFLPASVRQTTARYRFRGTPAVKDAIEAIGVPHPEVAHIRVRSAFVDFAYHLRDGDHVRVYPPFSDLRPADAPALRPPLPEVPAFVLDVHLGRLARYLRMLGFDTRHDDALDDPELARIAAGEDRVLLTRDLGLLKRGIVVHGYFVRATDPKRQLREILTRFNLHDHAAPLTRCLNCNTPLRPIDKAAIEDRLPPRTRAVFDAYFYCATCDQVYWKGTHYLRMRRFIDQHLNGQG